MDEETQTFELMAPASPEALVPGYGLWPWFTGGGILILLVITLLVVFRKRKSESASLLLQRIAAFSDANAALANVSATSARETAVLASLILRKYLSAAANDPALFETHEEFISRQDSLQVLTPQARAAADDGFTRLAALKYAPDIPDKPAAEVIADSRGLLDTLHRGFAA